MGHLKMKPKLICKEKYLDHFCLFQFILIKSLHLLYSLVSLYSSLFVTSAKFEITFAFNSGINNHAVP